MARIQLPKDQDYLAESLDSLLGPAESEANLHLCTHRIIDGYLAGVRKFMVTDRWAGEVQLAFEDVKGDLNLRYEEVLRTYMVEMGRWLKADLGPVTDRVGESLDAMRKAAVARAWLMALAGKLPMQQLKIKVLTPFLKYGTVGLCHYETGDPMFPDHLDIVPPRQLRGFPAWSEGADQLCGVGRKRWVPFDWLADRVKKVYKKDLGRYDKAADLMGQEVLWGGNKPDDPVNDFGGPGGGHTISTSLSVKDHLDLTLVEYRKGMRADGKNRLGQWYVPLEEVHVYDDTQQFTAHFLLKCGRVILQDERYEERGAKAVCPLQVARHTDIGRFFGRGFLSTQIPLNDQVEKMLSALFRNVKELDQFGTVLFSGGMGVDLKRWRTGPRPKADKYEIDPLAPNAQPMKLEPVNSGLLPAKVAEMGMGLIQKLAGQGPHYSGEATGRVDSAAGLGFLFNTGNTGLGLASNNLANAFSGVYARMLQVAKERKRGGVPLVLLEDAVAGVIINPTTGELSLDNNPIPYPWEVKIDVRDRTPKDRDIRKQELLELFNGGLLGDPAGDGFIRFWVTVYEENLDIPGAPKEIIETWRKAIWQILLLFGDGKTPGPRIQGEHSQDPNIHLLAVQRFMNKIEFSLASPEVKDEFVAWKQELEIMAGKNYPIGLPPPEALAQVQQQTQRPGGPAPAMNAGPAMQQMPGLM